MNSEVRLDEFPSAFELRNQKEIDFCNFILGKIEQEDSDKQSVEVMPQDHINTTGPVISSFFQGLGAKGYWVQIGRKDKPNKIVISWSEKEPREE